MEQKDIKMKDSKLKDTELKDTKLKDTKLKDLVIAALLVNIVIFALIAIISYVDFTGKYRVEKNTPLVPVGLTSVDDGMISGVGDGARKLDTVLRLRNFNDSSIEFSVDPKEVYGTRDREKIRQYISNIDCETLNVYYEKNTNRVMGVSQGGKIFPFFLAKEILFRAGCVGLVFMDVIFVGMAIYLKMNAPKKEGVGAKRKNSGKKKNHKK